MEVRHYSVLEYVLIRPSTKTRKAGDIEVCIDYGQKRIEVWKVTAKNMGRLSVFIDRFAIGLSGF